MGKTVAVIGGGPAGLSCALWLKRLALDPIVLEQEERLGGLQNLSPFVNTWYLGLEDQTGQDMAQRFRRHVESEEIRILTNSPVKRIVGSGSFQLWTATQDISADSIVIATGQRFKGPEAIAHLEGSDFLQTSDHVSFNPGDNPDPTGQVMAVMGGGDNGLRTAMMFAETAAHIHLFVRSRLRGFAHNQKAVLALAASGKLTLHKPSTLHRFEPHGSRIQITFKDATTLQQITVDYLCFRLGFAPNTELMSQLLSDGGVGSLALDAGGYVVTDPYLRTSIHHIYAAGDVSNPRDPCVATAVAQGAIAARSVDEDLSPSMYRNLHPNQG